jgi:hypothetical protein
MVKHFEKAFLLFVAFASVCPGQSTWIPGIVFPQGYNLYCITFANNKFVAVSDSGKFMSTPNLTNWTIQKSNTGNSLHSVAYGNGNYVAVGYGGTIVTLSDAGTMAVQNSGTTQWLTAVTYGGGQFVAAGVFGHVLTSLSATTWALDANEMEYQYSVVYANGTFMIVGNGPLGNDGFGGMYRTSPLWTVHDPNIPSCMLAVTYAAGRYVAAGDEGIIYSSSDGTTWTKRNSGTATVLRSVTFGNGTFVAVGDTGTILTSPDGSVWTKRNSHTNYPLRSVTCGAGLFAAVGPGGIVVISQADVIGSTETVVRKNDNIRPRINVSKDRIVISWPNRAAARVRSVALISGAGKSVYARRQPDTFGAMLTIPCSGFAAGTYYMSIVDQIGREMSLPVVVLR